MGNVNRIALIGLGGAGKSTLGRMLAEEVGMTFIELSNEIQQLAALNLVECVAFVGSSTAS